MLRPVVRSLHLCSGAFWHRSNQVRLEGLGEPCARHLWRIIFASFQIDSECTGTLTGVSGTIVANESEAQLTCHLLSP
jgi:hypothetical protein